MGTNDIFYVFPHIFHKDTRPYSLKHRCAQNSSLLLSFCTDLHCSKNLILHWLNWLFWIEKKTKTKQNFTLTTVWRRMHTPSTKSSAEHSATPAGLVARHVNMPVSSVNTSLMASTNLLPSRSIWLHTTSASNATHVAVGNCRRFWLSRFWLSRFCRDTGLIYHPSFTQCSELVENPVLRTGVRHKPKSISELSLKGIPTDWLTDLLINLFDLFWKCRWSTGRVSNSKLKGCGFISQPRASYCVLRPTQPPTFSGMEMTSSLPTISYGVKA